MPTLQKSNCCFNCVNIEPVSGEHYCTVHNMAGSWATFAQNTCPQFRSKYHIEQLEKYVHKGPLGPLLEIDFEGNVTVGKEYTMDDVAIAFVEKIKFHFKNRIAELEAKLRKDGVS